MAGHRIAVHSGGRRCGGTGGVDEYGGDGPAVHRAAVDGPQENQGGGGVPGVGQRDENSDTHGGGEAGQRTHDNTHHSPGQNDQQIRGGEGMEKIS